jgi:uncharacterized DUF497 family protein
MRYTWDEKKRASNLRDHGLDFVDAEAVFVGPTFTFEDARFEYGEKRYVTLGLLKGVPVSIVHTESESEIRVISFRKATDNEAQILFTQIQDQLPPPKGSEKPGRTAERRTSGGRAQAHRRRHRQKGPKGRPS